MALMCFSLHTRTSNVREYLLCSPSDAVSAAGENAFAGPYHFKTSPLIVSKDREREHRCLRPYQSVPAWLCARWPGCQAAAQRRP
jgi:hypothetical protein